MSEGLAQGPYVAARVGFEPATLRTQCSFQTRLTPLHIVITFLLINAHKHKVCNTRAVRTIRFNFTLSKQAKA